MWRQLTEPGAEQPGAACRRIIAAQMNDYLPLKPPAAASLRVPGDGGNGTAGRSIGQVDGALLKEVAIGHRGGADPIPDRITRIHPRDHCVMEPRSNRSTYIRERSPRTTAPGDEDVSCVGTNVKALAGAQSVNRSLLPAFHKARSGLSRATHVAADNAV